MTFIKTVLEFGVFIGGVLSSAFTVGLYRPARASFFAAEHKELAEYII